MLDPDMAERVQPQSVAGHARNVVEGAQPSYPGVIITVNAPKSVWALARVTFELVVDELVDNAVAYGGNDVEIELSATEADDTGQVAVRIADNRPGLPVFGREPLMSEWESPFRHTNGLGLWSARRTMANSNGAVEVRDNEPGGTIVELRLPKV